MWTRAAGDVGPYSEGRTRKRPPCLKREMSRRAAEDRKWQVSSGQWPAGSGTKIPALGGMPSSRRESRTCRAGGGLPETSAPTVRDEGSLVGDGLRTSRGRGTEPDVTRGTKVFLQGAEACRTAHDVCHGFLPNIPLQICPFCTIVRSAGIWYYCYTEWMLLTRQK